MARGTDAKARRKNERKEARQKISDMFENPEGEGDEKNDSNSSDESDSENENENEKPVENITQTKAPVPPGKKKSKSTKKAPTAPCCNRPSPTGKGIKPLPLIMLIMLTGTTVLPALIYMSDYLGNSLQRHHIMGSLGYKLGVGSSPKKRVFSFYEKHDPTKIPDVPNIMSKHYGDYPKLIKRLERKYSDYGYFIGWEEDEAPMKIALEKLDVTREYIGKQWQIYAPSALSTGVRNAKHNLGYLYRKGRKVWRKTVWPILEPYFGVPKGGAAQKRKDAQQARKKKQKKGHEFRDDDEM